MKNYRKLLVALGVTFFGSWFNLIAIVSIVYSLSGSKMALGITFFIKFLPKVLFSFFSAFILDRMSTKKIMFISELVAGLSVLGIVLVSKLSLGISVVYLFYFIMSAAIAVFDTARMAVIPQLTDDKEEYAKIVSQLTVVRYATMLIATGIGGVFLEFVGAESLLIVDFVTFIVSATLIASLKLDVKKKLTAATGFLSSISKMGEDLKVGFNEVFSNSKILRIILLFGFSQFVYGMAQTNFSLIVLDKLNASEKWLGMAYTIGGVACVLTGILFKYVKKTVSKEKYDDFFRLIVLPLNALFLTLMFNTGSLYGFLAIVFLHDIFATMFEIYLGASVVTIAGEETIGRISSFYMTFGRLSYLVAILLYTFVLTSVDYNILGIALGCVLVSAMLLTRSRKGRYQNEKSC